MYLKILFILLFCSFSAYSQNLIKGYISDSLDKTPIDMCNVYLPEIEKIVQTDEKGFFSINNIPKGKQKIIIYKPGYETQSNVVELYTISKDLSFELKPSVIEMDEVIVSTPFHKLQNENIMKVDKINISTLHENGSTSIAIGISEIPGVNNISTGLGIGKPVIRGLSSNRVLVYNQGVRIENQQFGEEHGLGLSDQGIGSIEVIKGPASLLYGSDAIGGILYINPEFFSDSKILKLNFNNRLFSNTAGYSTSIATKWSGKKIKYIFRVSNTSHADYLTKKYRVTNTRFSEKDFKSGLGFHNENFKTELRVNFNTSKIGIPEDGIKEQSKSRKLIVPYQLIFNQIISLKSNYFFNNSGLALNIGYTNNQRKEFEDHEEDHETKSHSYNDPALDMKLKTYTYDFKYHFKKFETIIGSQGMLQTNKNYGFETLIPDAEIKDFGIFLNSDLHFDIFDIQFGFRNDIRRIEILKKDLYNFNSFNVAFGIKINLIENAFFRINIASGFRAPNLAELTSYGVHHGTSRFEIGSLNLEKEHNSQIDISYEYSNKHFEIGLNGFYNQLYDYIYLSPTNKSINNFEVFEYVQSNASLYGGELTFHYHPHPLDILHLKTSFETVTGNLKDGSYLPLIPANKIKQLFRVNFKNLKFKESYAFFKVQSIFKQNKVSYFEEQTKGYTLFGLGLGGIINLFNNPLKSNISITNLTNKKYVSHLSRLKSDGIFDIGRNLIISLDYNF